MSWVMYGHRMTERCHNVIMKVEWTSVWWSKSASVKLQIVCSEVRWGDKVTLFLSLSRLSTFTSSVLLQCSSAGVYILTGPSWQPEQNCPPNPLKIGKISSKKGNFPPKSFYSVPPQISQNIDPCYNDVVPLTVVVMLSLIWAVPFHQVTAGAGLAPTTWQRASYLLPADIVSAVSSKLTLSGPTEKNLWWLTNGGELTGSYSACQSWQSWTLGYWCCCWRPGRSGWNGGQTAGGSQWAESWPSCLPGPPRSSRPPGRVLSTSSAGEAGTLQSGTVLYHSILLSLPRNQHLFQPINNRNRKWRNLKDKIPPEKIPEKLQNSYSSPFYVVLKCHHY